MADEYHISEEDIEVAMRNLKFDDPEHATREDAINMLKDLQSGYHSMSHNDPQRLLKLQKDIDERRAKRHTESDDQ
jgi:hypothetical protein